MLGSLTPSLLKSMCDDLVKKLEVHSINFTKGGQSDYSGYHISVRIKETGGSASFSISNFPYNCNLLIMYSLYGSSSSVRLKFEIVEEFCKLLGHAGILLSDTSRMHGKEDTKWELYEEFGFFPVLQDRGIQHGNDNDMRIYYKSLNSDRKIERGGKEWGTPVGFIPKEDLLMLE